MEPQHANPQRFLVGGYTQQATEAGVSLYSVDEAGRAATPLGSASGVISPSYLASHKGYLYAASEQPEQGNLAFYHYLDDGVPILEEQRALARSAGTCYTLIHPNGLRLYGANYNSGSLCSVALDDHGRFKDPFSLVQHEGHGLIRPADSPLTGRQDGSHVHTLSFVPHTKLLVAVDLGLDMVVLYDTDENGLPIDAPHATMLNAWDDPLRLEEEARFPLRPAALVETPAGAGPRLIAYHPTLPLAALICELSCEIIFFSLSADGLTWTPVCQINLLNHTPGIPNNPLEAAAALSGAPLSAHLAFSSDGKFLYASTRGTDRLAVFTIANDGTPEFCAGYATEGKTPRHFALSPDETLLAVANQTSDNLSIFRRDKATGLLEASSKVPYPHPSCILWV